MESSRCIVDSSIFVAFYRDIDDSHEDALRIMRELADSTLVVHPYVIQETATVLAYRCGVAVAKRFLMDIVDATNVIVPAVDARYDAQSFMSFNRKISFTDVALIELARTTGTRVVTFDRQILSFLKSS